MSTAALAIATLAATLLSPLPVATTDDGRIAWKQLVREHVGLSYTLTVNETCEDPFPYVHEDVFRGSIPEWVTFTYSGTTPNDDYYSRGISGSIFNWFALPAPYLALDLKCTSDARSALRAAQHIPPSIS